MTIFFSVGSDSIDFRQENVIQDGAKTNQSSLTPLKGTANIGTHNG